MNTDYTSNKIFKLSKNQIDEYRYNNCIHLNQVLSSEFLIEQQKLIANEVLETDESQTPLEKRNTYGKAFLQVFNLWQRNEAIRALVFSKRLASIAAQLMGVEGVRIYHDQALFKEPGGGITPWHADQYYWPLATDKTITAWIPLQDVPLSMGPLEFSVGSHMLHAGRELSISDTSEKYLNKQLRINDFPHRIAPYTLGDVSFHSGWVFHRAGANTTTQMRAVMTVIYMDQNMTLKAPENKGQQNDLECWCPGAQIGKVIDTPLNPVLYSKTKD